MKRHRMNLEQTPPSKKRKPRKPMTEEQRLAAAERLEAARAAKKTPQNISVHESIRDLPKEHSLHPNNVKAWIKSWKDMLSSIRHYKNSKETKEVAKYYATEAYIKNMQKYLESGVWLDNYWGEKRDRKMIFVCHAMAYDKNGNPKRTQGIYYPDINMIWGSEESAENAYDAV
jgi:hypothetical protein